MNSSVSDTEAAGPAYEDCCSVEFHRQPTAVSDAQNQMVLTAAAALEGQLNAHSADDSENRSPEWQALDSKLNVLIQMFAGFWRQQVNLPAPIDVRISVRNLRVARHDLPECTEIRSLSLYPHPAMPQALVLPVAQLREDPEDKSFCFLDFSELSQDLEDALARQVFRRHRRAVAQSRQASNLQVKSE